MLWNDDCRSIKIDVVNAGTVSCTRRERAFSCSTRRGKLGRFRRNLKFSSKVNEQPYWHLCNLKFKLEFEIKLRLFWTFSFQVWIYYRSVALVSDNLSLPYWLEPTNMLCLQCTVKRLTNRFKWTFLIKDLATLHMEIGIL